MLRKSLVKTISALAVVFGVALVLSGCGGQPGPAADTSSEKSESSQSQQAELSSSTSSSSPDEASPSEPSVEDSVSSSVSESQDEDSNPSQADDSVQRVGAEGIGFCDVPADWITLSDGMPSLKFANKDATQIVTLSLFDMSVVPATQVETFGTDDAAQHVLVALESEGATNISFSGGDLGGYEARVVSGSYPDGVNLVAWVFPDEAGTIHYMSVEADAATIASLRASFEASYSLAG